MSWFRNPPSSGTPGAVPGMRLSAGTDPSLMIQDLQQELALICPGLLAGLKAEVA